LYVLVVVVVAANVAELVSFGYGENGPQGIVGTRFRKNVVNIHNYSGSRVTYTKADKSLPAISLRSLPDLETVDLGNVITAQSSQAHAAELTLEEVMEPIPIRTRSKRLFR
jgi:hypothetical protein